LALIALLGFMAIAAGVDKVAECAPMFKQHGPNFAVPALILAMFQSWFAGVAFAAIAIGVLIPAAIMSIAASTYAAFASLILNVVVVIALTPVFDAVRTVRGADELRVENYV
jgi:hypothetical protein